MAAPTIGTVSFDKPLYQPGDTVIMTISYTPGASAPPVSVPEVVSVTGTATDQPSGDSAPVAGSFDVETPAPAPVPAELTTWVFTDSHGGKWTPVSDNGAEAVFTSVA